ncbi:FKBP-type peptidyl-prolyl cis-trans isomerase [Marinobacter alexandrii]|uniref:FKBP-type peptidyl-prolyl cis-trans isomerase n=1 Tax=Marinobacter alexandrii TaxID=2570351 RepID=UPI003299A4CC
MNIGRDTIATFHYSLKDDSGVELESSQDAQPTAYLHGANNIIGGLEEALEGHVAGDSVSVTLEPEKAYGLRRPEQLQKVPVKHLVFKGKLRPGMSVHLNTSEGRRPVSVTKVGRHSAEIDTNHPLAGKTLHFAIDILDVRQATAEEISHGHAHGPGGHSH